MGKNHIPNNYFPLGLKNNKVLPFDYRVEYLKGDGNAYINTLEKFNNETDEVEITIRAAGLNTQTVFGGRVSATSKFCIMGLGSTGYYDIYCSDGSAYADYRATAAAPGVKCILKMSKYGRYIYNAATLQNLNANTTVGVNFVMNDYAYLFYGSGSPWATNKFTGEIYGLVWKRYGEVIHEYIPVVKDGVGYMFDRATGRLVGNANTTGAFLFPERMEYEPEPENKPYDAEVAWLESTGTQYIDTGITGGSSSKIELVAASQNNSEYQALVGARNGALFSFSIWQYAAVSQSQTPTVRFDYVGSTVVGPNPNTGGGTWNISGLNTVVKDGRNNYLNGVQLTSNDEATFSCPCPFTLFAINNNGSPIYPAKCKMYSCKIYESGVLVRDFIPVRKNGAGCLYDKVSGQLFENQGTGTLLYGPDVRKLPYDAEVEWLKSDGNQYIDTGLLADSTLGYEIFAALISTWNVGIGAMGTGNYRHYIRRSANSNVGIGMKTSDGYSTHQYISDDCMHHFVVDWTSNTSLVDATYKSNLASFNNFSTGVTFHLFAIKQDANLRMGTFKIGRCTFFRNGVMVADYHPVRVGKVGCMYEAVTGTLVYNQGTGDFIVGNDLSDKEYDAEVEYIQQTTNQYIDTGVKVTKGIRAELKVQVDSEYDYGFLVFGSRVTNAQDAFVAGCFTSSYVGTSSLVNSWRFDYGTGSATDVQKVCSVDDASKVTTIRMMGANCGKRGTFNSYSVKSTLTSQDLENNLPIYLLACNTNGVVSYPGSPTKLPYGKLYYCKIWENDILRRDFIPVRRNGRGLLYDRVTKTLFGSPNGGFFTYGADRNIQEREAYDARVEYVETTSDTKQTIDTLLNADSTLGVEIGQMGFANFQEGVLYRGGSSSYIRHHLSNGITAGKWGYCAGPGTVVYGEVTAANSQFHCAVYDPVGKIGRVDSTITEIEDTSVWDTGLTYYLFDRHDSNGSNTRFAGRIYYARFFRNGELVADMIPVRKNGKGYLYDQVRGILFGGVGTLSYGDDLYEYVEDGLIGWYDAVDNTGLGFHSEDTLYWKNKANDAHNWTRYRLQNAMWKGGEMTLASEANNSTILPGAFTEPWDNGEIKSLEFAGMFNGTTNTSNTDQECQLFHDGSAPGTAPLNTTKINFINKVGTSLADCIYVTEGLGLMKVPFSYSTYLGKPFQLSCTTSVFEHRLGYAKLNGETVTTSEESQSGVLSEGQGVAVLNGRNSTNNRTLDGAIYGIRFYNRFLNDTERAKNRRTDIARYGVF